MENPYNELGNVELSRIILASAYVLCYLSVMWLQLQNMKQNSEKMNTDVVYYH